MATIVVKKWKEWAYPPGEEVNCATITLTDEDNPLVVTVRKDDEDVEEEQPLRRVEQIRIVDVTSFDAEVARITTEMEEDQLNGYPDKTLESPKSFKRAETTETINL